MKKEAQITAADDLQWMRQALTAAGQAADRGEVPVGAVIVRDGQLLATAGNSPIAKSDPSAHAEILALRTACRSTENYRLPGATLYVTLEPCTMCLGAMIHARIARLVYGAVDPKSGAVESLYRLAEDSRFNHRIETLGGLLAEECGELLRRFFRQRR